MSSGAERLLFNCAFNNDTFWVAVTLMEVQKLASFKTMSLQRRDTPTIWCNGFSGNSWSGMQNVKIRESSSVGR